MRDRARGALALIEVRRRPGHHGQGLLRAGPLVLACALGRGGTSVAKREGDGATPAATLRLLSGCFRGDRLPVGPPASRLRLRRIAAGDGWCDAPGDRNYNRPVKLPYAASAERMHRDDRLYDICLISDWNMRPAVRGRGSAIFLHVARPGFPPTEGCIALAPRAIARLLPLIGPRTRIRVHR